MTPKLSCEQVRDLSAEMALGTISGDDRAGLIAHISSCAKCRVEIEELSEVADAILLLGPEHEPPSGFESRVLASFNAPQRTRKLAWLTAAAVIVAAAIAAGSVLWVTADEREVAAHYQADLAAANGEYFGIKELEAMDGSKAGNIFAYEGQPSWVFVVFDDADDGIYRAELVTKTGMTDLGEVNVQSDPATWSADMDSLKDVRVLRFVGSDGEVLEARF